MESMSGTEQGDSLCLVCNGLARTELKNIFSDNKKLDSGLSLSEIVEQVVGRTVDVNTAHSQVLCGNCSRECNEYNEIVTRMNQIKWNMQSQFRRTLPNYNLAYESYNEPSTLKDIPARPEGCKKTPAMKTLVLPKSKLTPLFSNIFMPVNQKLSPGINRPISLKNCVILADKGAIGSKNHSMATLTKSTCTVTTTSGNFNALVKTEQSEQNNGNTASTKPEKEFQSFFSSNEKDQVDQITSDAYDPSHTNDSFGTATENSKPLSILRTPTKKTGKDKFVISEVEIMEGHGDSVDVDDDTILMEQDGSVIHMVRGNQGQLLFSGNNQISLVMPDEEESDTETSGGFKIDCQDSNDDSQIELQMSGDEETANAIIAASKKKGATYIKMDTGAMFRIKTVNGKLDRNGENFIPTSSIVEQNGEMFKCLLCNDSSKDGESVDDITPGGSEWGDGNTMDACDMMAHVRSKHCLRIFICELCGEVFRKRIALDKHMEDHGEKRWVKNVDRTKPHQCKVCKKKYSSKSVLEEHMNVHTGSRPYTCEVCSKGFISKYTYQGHIKTHSFRPRPFSCTECDKTFLTFQNLSAHLKTHTGVKDFVCNICDKAFTTQHNLDVHGIVHTGDKPFVCGLCQKAFARRAEIRDHMRTHTGERPFACDICDATFSQRSNLLSHRRATHLHDRRYECTQCDKRFKRRRLLDYHIMASHTGERPFKCEVCSATFIYPEHYKKHMRIHSGARPYECEVCNRTFNSRDNRNAHRYTHSDKKPYECLVCGAGYMRKPQLYTHMNSQGHLADMIVVNQVRLVEPPGEVTQDSEEMVVLQSNKIQTSRALVETEIKEFFTVNSIMDGTEIDADSEPNKEQTTFIGDGPNPAATTDEQSNKMAIDLVEGDVNEEHTLLTPYTARLNVGGPEDPLETTDVNALLAQDSQVITTDEEGNIVRIVQIQLPDGKTSWVALDP